MQQWEYIIVDVRLWRSGEQVYINGHPVERIAGYPSRSPENAGSPPSLYEVLEWLGKNGWEMTGIAPDEHYSKLFFKRPRVSKTTLPAPQPVPRLTSGRDTRPADENTPPSKKTTRG